MSPLPKNSGKTFTPSDESYVFLERVGKYRINQITNAVKEVPWSIHLLQLAWTAGPVTFIAMHGGYLLGFGTPAPATNIIFFVAYTIIFGIIGLTTRIVHGAVQNDKQLATQKNLETVIDRLPDLVFAVRDLSLSLMGPDERKREAAGILLRKADLGPEYIALAVEDLTNNAYLAKTAEQIEIFRRSGMQSRIQDSVEAIREEAAAAVADIAPVSPEVATLLNDRLCGRAPDPEYGMPRENNFIERVLTAMDKDNESLITLQDVEEMLVLAFELISGREIPILTFGYRGRWDLARATDVMEQARNRYRIAQATVYTRLDALAALVSELDEDYTATVSGKLSGQGVLDAARQSMNKLIRNIETLERQARFSPDSQRALREQLAPLATGVELASSLREAYRRERRDHAYFVRALNKWLELTGHRHEEIATLHTGRRHKGLRLYEDVIKLDDDQKLQVANALAKYFNDATIKLIDGQILVGKPGREQPLTLPAAKSLAVEVASTLEPYIGLSKPEVQRAINSTNATYLSGFELGTSAATKAGWGSAMVKEVKTDMGKAAERLALALVKTYAIKLDERAIMFLHDHYGANADRLRTLTYQAENTQEMPVSPPEMQPVLHFGSRWRRVFDQAGAILERHPVNQG